MALISGIVALPAFTAWGVTAGVKNSIKNFKETMDLLPEGIAFGETDGTVVFRNLAMDDLARRLTGKRLHNFFRFREAFPLARHMARRAQEDFDAGKFQDVAYFEPFYLKDFIATVSKKNLW